MPPPKNYYLDYFCEQMDGVVGRYGDLLAGHDAHFVARFNHVSNDAKRLLVRLYLRKGPLFLQNKLVYPEVSNTAVAVDELVRSNLVKRNPTVQAVDVIQLLPVAQSRRLFCADQTKCKKQELLSRYQNDETTKTTKEWGCEQKIIQPLHYQTLRILNLLYFGNEHQDLTSFILEDIGLLQFESVPLEPANRLFANVDDVRQYIHINDLHEQFFQMQQARQYPQLEEFAQAVIDAKPVDSLTERWARLVNKVAYRIEQNGQLQLAWELFSTNDRPPARERRCRIAFKQGNNKKAMMILESMESTPKSSQEIAFCRRFVNRVRKGLGKPALQRVTPTYLETHVTWQKGVGTVEEQACAIIPGAIWRENYLPMGVFGLIFWQVIFADVKGVWHHRFQAAPSDITEPTFIERRQRLVDRQMALSKAEWRKTIENNWNQKNQYQNPFVHWQRLHLDELLCCFDGFGKTQWQGVFEHLLRDIHHHRSGFPDLFVCDPNRPRFIEIKGPGDRLQDNQTQWLEVFHRLKIPAEVLYIQFDTP